jgi:hypothetical protein
MEAGKAMMWYACAGRLRRERARQEGWYGCCCKAVICYLAPEINFVVTRTHVQDGMPRT